MVVGPLLRPHFNLPLRFGPYYNRKIYRPSCPKAMLSLAPMPLHSWPFLNRLWQWVWVGSGKKGMRRTLRQEWWDLVSPQNGQETEKFHHMLQVLNEIWIWEARERNIRWVPEKEEKRKAWLSSDRSGHGRAQRNSGMILKGKIIFLGCSVCAGNSLCVRNMLLACQKQSPELNPGLFISEVHPFHTTEPRKTERKWVQLFAVKPGELTDIGPCPGHL